MSKKPTITDMLEAVEERASYHASSARHFQREFPNPSEFARHQAKADTFEAIAHLLRIVGTYEERSRKFFAQLLEEHRRG